MVIYKLGRSFGSSPQKGNFIMASIFMGLEDWNKFIGQLINHSRQRHFFPRGIGVQFFLGKDYHHSGGIWLGLFNQNWVWAKGGIRKFRKPIIRT